MAVRPTEGLGGGSLGLPSELLFLLLGTFFCFLPLFPDNISQGLGPGVPLLRPSCEGGSGQLDAVVEVRGGEHAAVFEHRSACCRRCKGLKIIRVELASSLFVAGC